MGSYFSISTDAPPDPELLENFFAMSMVKLVDQITQSSISILVMLCSLYSLVAIYVSKDLHTVEFFLIAVLCLFNLLIPGVMGFIGHVIECVHAIYYGCEFVEYETKHGLFLAKDFQSFDPCHGFIKDDSSSRYQAMGKASGLLLMIQDDFTYWTTMVLVFAIALERFVLYNLPHLRDDPRFRPLFYICVALGSLFAPLVYLSDFLANCKDVGDPICDDCFFYSHHVAEKCLRSLLVELPAVLIPAFFFYSYYKNTTLIVRPDIDLLLNRVSLFLWIGWIVTTVPYSLFVAFFRRGDFSYKAIIDRYQAKEDNFQPGVYFAHFLFVSVKDLFGLVAAFILLGLVEQFRVPLKQAFNKVCVCCKVEAEGQIEMTSVHRTE
ncbi:uncharacterized protein LOC134844939 [Symsagittifera roscoffensis]|uniref:uncharacterized protein LOC134844939 n=1 Tax=Symsagittifera roscoffensis TaxID=84072 RepID=UPI00307BB4A6